MVKTVRALGREFPVSDDATMEQIAAEIDNFFSRQNVEVRGGEAPSPAEGVGAGEAFLIGAGSGLTNVGRGAQRLLAQVFGTPEQQQALKQEGQFSQQSLAQLSQEQPLATLAGQVVGESAALPVAGVGGGAVRLGTAALAGGTASALSEAGQGEEAGEVAEAAGIGAVLGPVGEAVGALIGRLGPRASQGVRALYRRATGSDAPATFFTPDGTPTREALEAIDQLNITPDDFRAAFSEASQEITNVADLPADQAFRAQRAAQQGVRLTRGQSARDFAQQEAEQTLRNLSTEEGAQARLFFDQQQTDLINAQNRFVESLGGAIDATREGRGGQVKDAIRSLDQAARDNVGRLYDELAELPGGDVRLNGGALVQAKDAITGEIVPSDRIITGFDRIFNDFGIGPNPDPSSATFAGPLTFGNAEQFRKRLNKLRPSDPADIAAVSALKDDFDNFVAAATEQFPENTPIAEAAQRARSAAADRFKKFKAKDIVQNLTDFKAGTATDRVADSQVFDTLFRGSGKIESIRRVRNILTRNGTPESQQAWKSIQAQGVLDVLDKAVTETPDGFVVSGLKLNSAINRFGEDAFKQLLSPDQFKALKNLQSVVADATIPISGTTNPSGTAAKLFNTLNRIGLVTQGGLADKAASLTGAGVGAIKEAARRQDVLTGIQRGAQPQQRVNSLLRLASHLGAQRGASIELREEENEQIQ